MQVVHFHVIHEKNIYICIKCLLVPSTVLGSTNAKMNQASEDWPVHSSGVRGASPRAEPVTAGARDARSQAHVQGEPDAPVEARRADRGHAAVPHLQGCREADAYWSVGPEMLV